MMKKTLSKAETAQLFAQNAVLFGSNDGVPEKVVAELFGEEAVNFTHKMESRLGILANMYGIGDYSAKYLTEKGFYCAATYSNVSYLQAQNEKEEKSNG